MEEKDDILYAHHDLKGRVDRRKRKNHDGDNSVEMVFNVLWVAPRLVGQSVKVDGLNDDAMFGESAMEFDMNLSWHCVTGRALSPKLVLERER